MPRCFLYLVTAAVTASKGESGHFEDGNVLVRRHEFEAPEPLPQSFSQAVSVDSSGEIRTSKQARKQDRKKVDQLSVGSPAVPSSSDPADADDIARPPSPSLLIAASTVTSPPEISAVQNGAGKAVPVPAPTVAPSGKETSGASKQKIQKTNQHRLTTATLVVCMVLSAILGLLVVWRQAKVLLNKHRRGHGPEDFQEEVAKILKKRSSQASVRSKDSREVRQRPSQASSSSAPPQPAPEEHVPSEAPHEAAPVEAPTPPPQRLEEQDTEADAAGGGNRKNQPKI